MKPDVLGKRSFGTNEAETSLDLLECESFLRADSMKIVENQLRFDGVFRNQIIIQVSFGYCNLQLTGPVVNVLDK